MPRTLDISKHITKTCLVCDQPFTSYRKQNRICCSTPCAGIFRSGRDESKFITAICVHCGKEFRHYRHARRKCCSKTCAAKNRRGKKAAHWQGGKKLDEKGYILLYAPNHPFAARGGYTTKYVREHRMVMEKHLGRFLKPEEVVHHLNGKKTDNRISNLRLFANHSEHMRFCKAHKHKS